MVENVQAAQAAENAPIVPTTAGLVRGFWRPTPGTGGEFSQSAAFLGIPFAEAPVGPLRFDAPVPHAAWDGIRDALTFGATAQRPGPDAPTLIPEPSFPGDSILNVNVFTPVPDPTAALPVMVYIHGGGFFAGSPASPWYDGAAFNRDGIITVSISYRLGFEGFGAIPDAPNNRAVLDWILALRWVQDNIASFGGDPTRVTVAGQSAGGGAVLTLIGVEEAQLLFAQGYSISGALADVPLARAQTIGAQLAELAGVEYSRAGFESLPEATIFELQDRAQQPNGKKAGMLTMMRGVVSGGMGLGPVVDGELITRPSVESLARSSEKPLYLGSADDEMDLGMAGLKAKLRFIPRAPVLALMGLPKEKRGPYLAANQEVAKQGATALVGRFISDSVFRKTALEVVRERPNTWLYRFSWPSGKFGKAVHCLDVPFIFDCLAADGVTNIAGPSAPAALAGDVHGAAVAFIKNGTPGWAPYSEKMTTRIFDTPSTLVFDGYASARPLL